MRSSNASWGLKVGAVLGMAFLHVPMLFIILYAFSAEDQTYVFPPPGLTAKWFAVAWERTDVWLAIRLSLAVAAWATALSIVASAKPCATSSSVSASR